MQLSKIQTKFQFNLDFFWSFLFFPRNYLVCCSSSSTLTQFLKLYQQEVEVLEEVVLVLMEVELELVPELEEEGEELLLEGVEGQEQVQLACLNMGTAQWVQRA